MTDIVLTPVTTGYNISNINTNFTKLQTKVNTGVLNLVGGSNVMQQDLDFNGFRALNMRLGGLAAPVLPTDAVRLVDLSSEAAIRTAADTGLQTQLNNLILNQTSGIIGYDTLASLNADLNKPAGTVAIVTNDSTTSNNTTYRKTGASGTGSWVVAVDRITNITTNLASPTGSSTVGFIQSGSAAVARTLQDKARERPSLFDVIPVSLQASIQAGTSTTDVSAYINQALVNYKDVFIPAGTYYINSPVQIPSGVKLYGSDKSKTTFIVPNTFNLSGLGVFYCNSGDPGPVFQDFTIKFIQPDTNVLSNLVAYPPAFYLRDIPRFTIRNVRIECGMVGIDMKGNTGGAVIDNYESCCFTTDIDIGGALDSVKISKLHIWPFGLITPSRPLLYTLYQANTHTGIKCERADDLHITDSIIFNLPIATNFYNSGGGSVFGNIVNCDFDNAGGLNASAGVLNVVGCYFSLGRVDAVCANLSGGAHTLTGCTFNISAQPTSNTGIAISGTGTTVCMASNQSGSGALDTNHITVGSGASLNISASNLNRNSGAYSRATILYNGGTGTVVGCSAATLVSGSGNFVEVAADTDVKVLNCSVPNWSFKFPATVLTKAKFAGGTVIGSGGGSGIPDASGNLTVAHTMPMTPNVAIPVAVGSGGFVHMQLVSSSATNMVFNVRSTTGPITTSVSYSWVAFA